MLDEQHKDIPDTTNRNPVWSDIYTDNSIIWMFTVRINTNSELKLAF